MAFLCPLPATTFALSTARPRDALCGHRPASLAPRPQPLRSRRSRRPSAAGAVASIEEEVSAELQSAMRRRDTASLKALRMIRAGFVTALKSGKSDGALSDDEAVGVLRKLAKMRAESMDMFRAGNRPDLADAEAAELAVIERWLPTQAGEEAVRAWVAAAVAAVGAEGVGDMGKVIGLVMKEHRGEVDGNMVRAIAAEALKSG